METEFNTIRKKSPPLQVGKDVTSTEEINQYRADFSNMELLSDNDKAFVQQMINYIVRSNTKERNCNNEI